MNRNDSPTTEARQRDRCEITGCESPAIYRGTCSPEHYKERALRRRAALHRIKIDGPSEPDNADLDAFRAGAYNVTDREAVVSSLCNEVERLRAALTQIADDRDAERKVTDRQMRSLRTALANAEAAGFVDAFGDAVEGGDL